MLMCDFCGHGMDADETGLFLVAEQLGGHIACVREWIDAHERAIT